MALLKRGKSKRLVLDIGTSAVRLCELSPTKSGYQLTKYLQRDFVLDPSAEEEEKQEHRQEVVQELIKEAKVRSKKAVVAVPGQSVFTRNRPLPPVPEHKVTQIVRYEIQQQIPFSLDQIALDYQVLDRTEAGGYEVMMAAIKVDVVEKQVQILNDLKKSIDVVDVSPLAAYNWLRHTGEFGEEGQCVALVDLGATTTDIVIQKDNQFKFTRSLHVGSNDITTAIASSFNMSYADAEKLKREKGFAPTGDPKRDGKGGEVIGRVLSRLVGEINRSFSYFRSQPGGGPVVRVIVTGGGACLRNIIPYLQRSLNIEVRIAQPLAGLAIAPAANDASEHPEQACVALGLALRCCEDVPIEINLIPPVVLEIAKRKEQIFYWLLSLVTLYLILASIIPITVQQTEAAKDNIATLEGTLARYDAALIDDPTKQSEHIATLGIARSDVKKFVDEVKVLDGLSNNRPFWLDKLMAVWEARNASLHKGNISFSSIQTIVLGGRGNTGQAGRIAAARSQTGGAAPKEQPKKKKQAPKPKNGGGSGFSGGFGNVASISESLGSGTYQIQGFPGIRPPAGLAGASKGAGSMGGDKKKAAGKESKPKGPIRVTEPNALAIFGYADSLDALKELVRQLESSEAFLDKGVYWHQKYTEDVPVTTLAAADAGSVKQVGNKAAAGGKKEDKSGFSVGEINISTNRGRRRGAADDANMPKIWEFRVDVQWLGKPVQHPDETGN